MGVRVAARRSHYDKFIPLALGRGDLQQTTQVFQFHPKR